MARAMPSAWLISSSRHEAFVKPARISEDPGESEPLARERPRPSVSSAQHAAVLQQLVRPRAGRRARLAESQVRRAPCRRPRPVTHMMADIRVVLVPVAPFIARSVLVDSWQRGALTSWSTGHSATTSASSVICVILSAAYRARGLAMRRHCGGPSSGMQSQCQPTRRSDLDDELGRTGLDRKLGPPHGLSAVGLTVVRRVSERS